VRSDPTKPAPKLLANPLSQPLLKIDTAENAIARAASQT
jgi:hypothetical protein